MSSLRVLRRRIRSVQSTEQITKAMELVSAAKLRRAQRAAESARPYAETMAAMLGHLSRAATAREHPLFERRAEGATLLVVISADRGFCGAFNANLVRRTVHLLREPSGDGVKPGEMRLLFVGKKAWEYFRRRTWPIAGIYRDLGGQLNLDRAQEITHDLLARFLSGEVREVQLLYTRFVSTLVRRVTVLPFLPIVPAGTEETPAGHEPAGGEARGDGAAVEYIFEPSPERIFETLLPRYALSRVMAAMLESFAAEHAARMVAMGSASKNAEEMIDDLVLLRNRIRQAGITKEIAELVGGSEALK
jgi:F-type H+-transporting ATPase subunit gamma